MNDRNSPGEDRPEFRRGLARIRCGLKRHDGGEVAYATLGSEGTFKTVSLISGRATLGWHSRGTEDPLLLMPGGDG